MTDSSTDRNPPLDPETAKTLLKRIPHNLLVPAPCGSRNIKRYHGEGAELDSKDSKKREFERLEITATPYPTNTEVTLVTFLLVDGTTE